MIKNLGQELQQSIERWQQLAKEIEQYCARKLAEIRLIHHSNAIAASLEEWANETEKQLNSLFTITKETVETCKQEPQNYKQLLS